MSDVMSNLLRAEIERTIAELTRELAHVHSRARTLELAIAAMEGEIRLRSNAVSPEIIAAFERVKSLYRAHPKQEKNPPKPEPLKCPTTHSDQTPSN